MGIKKEKLMRYIHLLVVAFVAFLAIQGCSQQSEGIKTSSSWKSIDDAGFGSRPFAWTDNGTDLKWKFVAKSDDGSPRVGAGSVSFIVDSEGKSYVVDLSIDNIVFGKDAQVVSSDKFGTVKIEGLKTPFKVREGSENVCLGSFQTSTGHSDYVLGKTVASAKVRAESKTPKVIIVLPNISLVNSLTHAIDDGKNFSWKVAVTNGSGVKATVTVAIEVYETDAAGKLLVKNGVPVRKIDDKTVTVEPYKTKEVSGKVVFDSPAKFVSMDSHTTHIDGKAISEIK
jgi:hypothetical protein